MSLERVLRKALLCLMLGARAMLGLHMSQEKIEELLYSTNQPRAEVTISEANEENDLGSSSVTEPRK